MVAASRAGDVSTVNATVRAVQWAARTPRLVRGDDGEEIVTATAAIMHCQKTIMFQGTVSKEADRRRI